MNEFLFTWLALVSVQLAATISPGPAFAMTLRNALSSGRSSGIYTAIGLSLGIGVHIVAIIFGLALIISQLPLLLASLKYGGAAYLIWIGIKSVLAKKKGIDDLNMFDTPIKNKTAFRRIQNGLVTNILNPKALIFCTAVYSQFIGPDTPLLISALYGFTGIMIEFTWFSLVSIILTTTYIRTRFFSCIHWLEQITGGLLIILGIRLAVSEGAA